MAKQARQLEDIELKEVSIVKSPANQKKFLFFKGEKLFEKQKTKIEVTSDGTVAGTSIKLNGDVIDKLESFNFGFWPDSSGSVSTTPERSISCSYTQNVETSDGFKRSETFYLAKGVKPMKTSSDKVKTFLKSYFGDVDIAEIEKAIDIVEIEKALETIDSYKGDFPDDLKTAVGMLVRESCQIPAKVEKSKIEISKDILEEIQNAIDALEALKTSLPSTEEKSTKDETEVEKNDLKKQIEVLTKSVELLEKNDTIEDAEVDNPMHKTLQALNARIEKMEKAKGIKKSITDQEDSNDDKNKGENLWPSLNSNSD